MPVKLSVLDFMPLRTDQSTADAMRTSVRLAQTADRLGYERYWVSEHHDMPYASTHPGVAVSTLAAKTHRIRVGSGGVMVPNHTAFDLAEQFAFLEAAYPERIDLGIGRAPAGNQAAIAALRNGARLNGTDDFIQEVKTIISMLDPAGLPVRGKAAPLMATPAARTVPSVWMLGSSPRSAVLAAEAGIPYAYAHHFFGTGTNEAVDTYRSRFQPSEHTPRPRLIITMNAAVAETEDEAHRLALPNLIHTVDALTGGGEQPLMLVEDASSRGIPHEFQAKAAQLVATWVVGDAEQARSQIEAFAQRHDADEIMIQPIAGAYAGTASDRSPANEETLRLLASPPDRVSASRAPASDAAVADEG